MTKFWTRQSSKNWWTETDFSCCWNFFISTTTRTSSLVVETDTIVKALALSANIEVRDLTQKPSRRSADAMEITRLNGRHFPTPIPPAPNSKKDKPTRSGKVCNDHGLRRETRFMCEQCNRTALCVHPCFQNFHTLKHYWMNYRFLLFDNVSFVFVYILCKSILFWYSHIPFGMLLRICIQISS